MTRSCVDGDGPAVVVFGVVVSAAQPVQVGFGGVGAVEGHDVVQLAGAGSPVAAGHAAGAVAQDHPVSQRLGGFVDRGAVDQFTERPDDGAADRRGRVGQGRRGTARRGSVRSRAAPQAGPTALTRCRGARAGARSVAGRAGAAGPQHWCSPAPDQPACRPAGHQPTGHRPGPAWAAFSASPAIRVYIASMVTASCTV